MKSIRQKIIQGKADLTCVSMVMKFIKLQMNRALMIKTENLDIDFKKVL
jgi:hypothetical protein